MRAIEFSLFFVIIASSSATNIEDDIRTYINFQNKKFNDKTFSLTPPTIIRLSLENNSIEDIEPGAFKKFHRLTMLEIQRNNFMTIQPNMFEGLQHLLELHISKERNLTTLKEKVFSKLENLKTLHLKENNLMTLELGVFDGLKKLEELNLRKNNLMDLQPGIFKGLNQLQGLSINNNGKKIPLKMNVFNDLKNLELLELEESNLTTLELGVFNGLGKLEKLVLFGNNLINLQPGIFRGLHGLKELSILNESMLMTLDPDLFNDIENLELLDFMNNQVLYLGPEVFGKILKLKTLFFCGVKLTEIQTDTFNQLHHLVELKISFQENIITFNNNSFRNLNNLTQLTLEHNNLTYLEPGIFNELQKIKFLNLMNNSLTDLEPGLFFGLINREEIYLDLQLNNNKIKSIQNDTFKDLNLRKLNLNNNHMKEITRGAFNGLKVDTLLLAQNQLTTIEIGAFDGIISVNKIDLSNNKLSCFVPEFSVKLPWIKIFERLNLTKFYLNNNPMNETVPAAFPTSKVNKVITDRNITTIIKAGNLDLILHVEPLMISEFPGSVSFQRLPITKIDKSSFSSMSPWIKALSLIENEIDEIEPQSFKKFHRLKLLSIRSNKLTKLQFGIFEGLSTLNHLVIGSENNLTTIENNTFDEIENLRWLDFTSAYSIHLMPGVFKNLRKLVFLDFSYSHLEDLTPGIFDGLGKLKVLQLSSNSLKKLKPGIFAGLETLDRLDLSRNLLEDLEPRIFTGLDKLFKPFDRKNTDIDGHSLEFSHNKIKIIKKDTFKGLNLNVLNLIGNKIGEILPGVFNGLTVIQLLLVENEITFIKSGTFDGIIRVDVVDLTDNPIVQIENNAFLGLTVMRSFHISSTKNEISVNKSAWGFPSEVEVCKFPVGTRPIIIKNPRNSSYSSVIPKRKSRSRASSYSDNCFLMGTIFFTLITWIFFI